MSAGAGGLAYFIPAAQLAIESTGQVIHVTPSPSTLSPSASGSPSASAAPISGAFTVLLLGSDDDSKFSADHVLTQSMILVRVVPATKQVTMLSIPRDLYVHLSTGGSGKIDGAYSYGGPSAAVATVEQDFNVHVDEYIWIGLLGLVKLIDAIGGINVVTSSPVLDDYYPADLNTTWPYDYERVAVLAGPQHLDGVHAMQYVRSRHGDLQSDIGRSQRQQQVLIAIRQKAKQLSPEDLPAISQALGGELKTSMPLSKVAQLLPLAASFDNPDTINQVVLANPYTHGCGCSESYLTANWGLILPLVHQYFP
ncbi:MAG: LytR family transcriptional regulator [Chloroflexi bacterium]|nr:MAG: LytR family transcriptional regulator [Chloroflexota bacterium]TME41629.1 MAG: LytR family transcriptional regulator [Chloroflexota bacterium]TME51500.1 MAG: LytR family transcriptional regulator [Chloroflexota bacterium]